MHNATTFCAQPLGGAQNVANPSATTAAVATALTPAVAAIASGQSRSPSRPVPSRRQPSLPYPSRVTTRSINSTTSNGETVGELFEHGRDPLSRLDVPSESS